MRRAGFDRRQPSGFSLVDTIVVVFLVGTLGAMSLPLVLTGLDESHASSAASYLATRLRQARTEAVRRSRSVGLRFVRDGEHYKYRFYLDEAGDGVRTADIDGGVDVPLWEVERIGDQFPGVAFGIARDVVGVDGGPSLPAGSDPLRIGGSDLLIFTPSGTSTGGTLYLRSRGGAQYAVRVFGVTGRTRVLAYAAWDRQWRLR